MITANELMTTAVEVGASDLHLNPGRPPVGRVNGELVSLGSEVLDDASAETLCRELCDDQHWAELEEIGTTDLGLAHESGNRFRVSCMRQRGRFTAILRLIPNKLLTFDEIGLPEPCRELLRRPRGLILVTGPTGSGKSTTLATMIDWINQTLDRHIVTIEDPIEFYHSHGKGLVTQREVGSDVPNFPEAMRRVLRQDPDVILLGEMRDLETISAAITAAETGHLVFGTLHTTGSARTVNRMIDAFPANQQEQIRMASPNQIHILREDVNIERNDLLRVPAGEITLEGVRQNLSVGICYIAAWLSGNGCVPIDHLMEDAATAEISRAQLWQWQRHGVRTTTGEEITKEFLLEELDKSLAEIREQLGDVSYAGGCYDTAGSLFREQITAPTLDNFLTLSAYKHLKS